MAFYAPEIPGNTGNAIRLAAVTGAHLHLVEPLGFDFDDAKLRRAGLDYHDLAHTTRHKDFDALIAKLQCATATQSTSENAAAQDTGTVTGASATNVSTSRRLIAFSTVATHNFAEISYRAGDVLLFGSESSGLPEYILADPRIDIQVRIPMLPSRRSLNLANSAAIAVYEVWRQWGFAGGT